MEIRLPFPVSVNDMYANNKKGGRGRFPSSEYKAWKADASDALYKQRTRPVLGRCEVRIDLDDTRKGDADNRAKPVLDALVAHGILGGDSKKYVRRVSIGWERLTGCRVAILEDE